MINCWQVIKSYSFTGNLELLTGLINKSRMRGDFQVRFCERLGLKCPCLPQNPDSLGELREIGIWGTLQFEIPIKL